MRRRLERLPISIAERIERAITSLGSDPRPPGVEKLKGHDDLWRLRVGDYRVVYRIHDDQLEVIVIAMGHRRDVYRDF